VRDLARQALAVQSPACLLCDLCCSICREDLGNACCCSHRHGSAGCVEYWRALTQHASELFKGHLLSSLPCSGQDHRSSKGRSSSSSGVGQVGAKTLVLCWAFSFPFLNSLKTQLPWPAPSYRAQLCALMGCHFCAAPTWGWLLSTLHIARSYGIRILPLFLFFPFCSGVGGSGWLLVDFFCLLQTHRVSGLMHPSSLSWSVASFSFVWGILCFPVVLPCVSSIGKSKNSVLQRPGSWWSWALRF